jgi:hypothetical protein
MHLKFIAKGTSMDIQEKLPEQVLDTVYQAKFSALESDMSCWVEDENLYQRFHTHLDGSPAGDSRLQVTFFRGSNMFIFTGKPIQTAVRRGAYLTLIEQVTEIDTTSRREHPRDEINVKAWLYRLSEDHLQDAAFQKGTEHAVLAGNVFDLSAGGLCVTSNDRFKTTGGIYYLVEFVLGGKYQFLLPVKLLREGKCQQTALYRYEYGFAFLYDHLPNEQVRLVTAIFEHKMSRF